MKKNWSKPLVTELSVEMTAVNVTGTKGTTGHDGIKFGSIQGGAWVSGPYVTP